MGRLLELNLYIDVKSNTHPDFIRPLKTRLTLTVGKQRRYKLPDARDTENNERP